MYVAFSRKRKVTPDPIKINSRGNPPKLEYSKGGCQPIDSYNLSSIFKDNFLLVTKALWNENTSLNFFERTSQSRIYAKLS